MQATMVMKEKTVNFDYDSTESSFWQGVGKQLLEAMIPNTIHITCPHGTADLSVKKRGTYTEDGVVKPSMFVDKVVNNIYGLAKSVYKKVYLTCIHPESNNYKAYILRPTDSGIYADYGSIDDVAKGNYRTVKTPYESYLYWIRYYEKLSKGYKDRSAILLDTTPVRKSSKKAVAVNSTNDKVSATEEVSAVNKADNAMLYKLLTGYAKKVVNEVLATPQNVTERQVAVCRKLWNKLGTYKTVSAFNKCLAELISLSPRKRNPLQDDVKDFFAYSERDFADIINFEENLILAMEGSIGKANVDYNEKNLFRNTEIFLANEKQKDEVMKILGTSDLKNKVKRIWRVKPLEQEKKFAKYCKENGIKTIKKFWHGSRNENWASIVQNGLLLNPNAVITGKMFGQGIYFAPSPAKSFGYTSYNGSYWANGKANCGFMGIYATAYGTPYMTHSYGDHNGPATTKANKCNCLHATPANTGLRNDEVVFYNESAVVMNYLVEFGD